MTSQVFIDTREFEQRLQEHLDEKCEEIAEQIKNDAKRTVAFVDKTGKLRKSIKKKKSKFEDGGYIVKAGGRGAMQAFLVEHGHGGPHPAPAHPFLKPALDRNVQFARLKLGEKMKSEG